MPALGGGKTHAAATDSESIRQKWETPALRIVQAIHKEFAPTLDPNDGGEILRWILDLIEQVHAAALASASSGPQWETMESAPRGILVLVHDEGYVGKGMLHDDGRWEDIETAVTSFFDPAPTEWLPLPAPPDGSLCATPEKE